MNSASDLDKTHAEISAHGSTREAPSRYRARVRIAIDKSPEVKWNPLDTLSTFQDSPHKHKINKHAGKQGCNQCIACCTNLFVAQTKPLAYGQYAADAK